MTYALDWGKDIWTYAQINFAQAAILENISYRILPLWDKELIADTLVDMQRAGQQYEPLIYDEEDYVMIQKEHMLVFKDESPIKSGKAVFDSDGQMTPAETPMVDDFDGLQNLYLETKNTLSGACEPFPAYVNLDIE